MEKETINRLIREWSGINRDDFDHDLNAMHEAELHSFKTAFERVEYRRHLENVASRTREPDEEHVIDSMETWAMFATAAQRAEALLRTIGKWKEE